MSIRTDLALEQKELNPDQTDGIESEETILDNIKITRIRIKNKNGERALGKPIGTYVTVETPPLTDSGEMNENAINAVSSELISFLPKGLVLVAGLGNTSITPDAIGPKAAKGVLATRHIEGEIARSIGLDNMRPVAVISPGVLGQTGIETGEIIAGIARLIKPSAVIVIDALASRCLSRLGCTIQMSDTGICPGSGVGNRRAEISKNTIGVPVISVGIPTVVDAVTLAQDLTGHKCENTVNPRGAKMIVTPQEIDLLVSRGAATVSMAINYALQENIDRETIMGLI
ncbi:MAG: GPR endopeptidase [Clostridia bacterium]|nr:GPR endopeptidase [Clostridia bacterium]